MLSILNTFKLKWWQAAIYEIALICLGIIIGMYWPVLLSEYETALWGAFLLGAVYIFYVWYKQLD